MQDGFRQKQGPPDDMRWRPARAAAGHRQIRPGGESRNGAFARLPLCLATALLGLSTACTPIPVDQAEAACVRKALYGGGPQGAVTVGIGTGTGGWGGWGWGGGGGAGIAMSTTLPMQSADPATEYANCVRRKSGQPPVTPFGRRPELQG
jgi:hypothetical protein